jgi:putative ABC transport system permease protein
MPSFSIVAIATLALGIGANTAMFSVVYGILLRPLPYQDADRLALIQREQDIAGTRRPMPTPFFSPVEMAAWQQRLTAFEPTAFYSNEVAALSTDRSNEMIETAVVSREFFATIAGPIAVGRPLQPADDLNPSVVVSDRLAERLFGGAPAALGQRLTFSSQTYTVVGVADAAFQFPSAKTDVWMASGFVRTVNPRCCGFRMLARLKPHVTIAEAGAEVAAAAKASTVAVRGDVRATAIGLRDQLVGTIRPALLVLFAAVALVLVVACSNVVNLLLARQVTREREATIRWALGASQARLVQETMIESALLATIGSTLGIALALAGVRLLTRWQPPGLPRLDAVHVDVPVLLFSSALAVVAAIGAGLLPAWQSAASADALKLGATSATSAPRGRGIRRALCALELAVSVVLLIGATLLGRSLVRLMQTDLGVTTDHVVTASINLAFGGRPTDAQTLARVDRVIERLRSLPGVRAVGVGTALPPNASRLMLTMRRSGDSVDYRASGVAATPDYFHALGMRLRRGRLFTPDDDFNHPPVMIMSVDTAKRFFGDGDPIGRTMTLPVNRNGVNGSAEMTLVGTIANVKYSGLDAAADDAVYRPFTQQTWVAPYLVVRTAGDPQALVPTIGREIAAVDRGIVISDLRPLDAIVSDAAAPPRFRTVLLAAVAGLALSMAIVGLYGVIAYSVAQRTKEIGIRMALGANRGEVLAMVLREGGVLAAAGLVGGLAIAAVVTRALSGLLYGIAPTDAASFVFASATLAVVALAASYLPARRAASVDPLIALRDE